MNLKTGEIYKHKDEREIRILEIRDDSYFYPIWFIDTKTLIPNGCKISDLIIKEETPKKTQLSCEKLIGN